VRVCFMCFHHTFLDMRISMNATGWRRVTGCLIFICHFPQKSSKIGGSFAERDAQFKAFCASPLESQDALSL